MQYRSAVITGITVPDITFSCSDDDQAWLKSQAEELGIDDIGMTVRIIVRDARKRGVGFGIVANGQQNVAMAVAARTSAQWWQQANKAEIGRRLGHIDGAPSLENAPAADFELPPEPQDEVATILAEGSSAVEAMLQQAPAIKPSPGYRKRADKWKAGASRPALQVVDGPGSRTSVVDAGELARLNPRELSPQDQVVQQNLHKQMDKHFGRAASRG